MSQVQMPEPVGLDAHFIHPPDYSMGMGMGMGMLDLDSNAIFDLGAALRESFEQAAQDKREHPTPQKLLDVLPFLSLSNTDVEKQVSCVVCVENVTAVDKVIHTTLLRYI